jgi:hypothetical protein
VRTGEVPQSQIDGLARALLRATERLFANPATAEDFARWEREYDARQAIRLVANQ